MGDSLDDWIDARYRDSSPDALHTLDLDAFLADTARFADRPTERLRRLAICLEECGRAGCTPEQWSAVCRVYDRAIALDPQDALVRESLGVSARSFAEANRGEFRARMLRESLAAASDAVRMDPDDAHAAYSLGRTLYDCDDDDAPARALQWFRRAVALDPSAPMAQLYEAHCLHDARDWDGAIAAYERVNMAAWKGDAPRWRVIKLREQLAYCHAQRGNLARATELFAAWMDELERADEETLVFDYSNVDDLAAAVADLLPALRERARACVLRVEGERARTYYPRLFDD